MEAIPESGPNWIILGTNDVRSDDVETSRLIASLQENILKIAVTTPEQFSADVVDLIRTELTLSAVSLWTRSRGLEGFRLEAATGIDYGTYLSFLKTDPSYASIACGSEPDSVLVAFPPIDHTLLGDPFRPNQDVSCVVVTPLYAPSESISYFAEPLGAVCLYVPAGADLDQVIEAALRIQRLVGSLFIAALERRCMDLREKAVEVAAFEGELHEMCGRLLRLFCSELGFESASIWLLNPRRQQMLLRYAWPRARNASGELIDYAVRLDSPSNPLAITYRDLEQYHYPRPSAASGGTRHYIQFDTTKIMEDYGPVFHNTLSIPLKTAHTVTLGHVQRNAVGVIQLTNKCTDLGGARDYIPATWVDLKLVDYLAEITAVLVFQGIMTSDHEAEYERRIHGLEIHLIGARSELMQLEDRGDLETRLDPSLKYKVSNAIEWIREMEQQVGRRDNVARLAVRLQPVNLHGGTLAKILKSARDYARARDVRGFVFDAEDLLTQPHPIYVQADPRALSTVFRNLVENSIKYRRKDADECRVELWVDPDESSGRIRLHYMDNGIGIYSNERQAIFEEGYRGHVARVVHVTGEGIGLHECKVLMSAMRGDISCEEPIGGGGAHFVIVIPTDPRARRL